MRLSEDVLRAALREAFDAGLAQGNDEATASEWGHSPDMTADAAFDSLFEAWNSDAVSIHAALAAIRAREEG